MITLFGVKKIIKISGPEKGFINPIGVTTDGTNVYVADWGANAVFKVDPSKNVTTFVNITRPVAIAYSSNKLLLLQKMMVGKYITLLMVVL